MYSWNVYGNLLTGSFPWSSFANNSSVELKYLACGNNLLSGSFPSESIIHLADTLAFLDFESSNLEGTFVCFMGVMDIGFRFYE